MVALALTVCFWVVDPVHTSLSYKSNIADAIAQVRHEVTPGSLVLTTQPEQVPTAKYYLPAGLRYGTPLGPVADPSVVDWRNALALLRRSSVRRVLMPMVDSLSSGQRVVLIVPLRLQPSPLWLQLIKRDSGRWAHALERDPLLRQVAQSSAGAGGSGVPVQVTVFAHR